jgi:hypothetical protein
MPLYKLLQNSKKNLKIDWNMTNPNKIFGAPENISKFFFKK